jgi:uncharacterized protein YcbX
MSIQLSGLFVYPVKALGGVEIQMATAQPEGLANDRRWVIVGPDGRFISQRSHPALARIKTRLQPEGLILTAAGQPPLDLRPPTGESRRTVSIWNDEVNAAAAAPAADRWLSEFLGEPCHLAWMDPLCRRPITSSGGRDGEAVSFADGYPCLVISEASLTDLNGRLSNPVPMNRFRPNLVVSGCGSFAEDTWRTMTIGDVRLRAAGPCARCAVTTVDQETGRTQAPEPLRTLATYRNTDKGAIFGANLVVEKGGNLQLGDTVRVDI